MGKWQEKSGTDMIELKTRVIDNKETSRCDVTDWQKYIKWQGNELSQWLTRMHYRTRERVTWKNNEFEEGSVSDWHG